MSTVKQIQTALQKLEKKLVDKVIKKEIRENLKPIKAAVAAAAPTGSGPTPRLPHGQIKRYVKIQAKKRSRARKAIIGLMVTIRLKRDKGEPYWAKMTEVGTKLQKGQGWMLAVYKNMETSVKNKTINDIKKAVDIAVREVRVP